MDSGKQSVGLSRYAIAALIGLLVFIFLNPPSKKLEDEVNRYTKSLERANEEETLRREESFVNKIVKNESYSNPALIALALKDDTEVSAESALFLALDERGFKFSGADVQDHILRSGFRTVRGRLSYVRFLRDSKEATVLAFVRRGMTENRNSLTSEQLAIEQKVCWRLAVKKFPKIEDLRKDPQIDSIVKSFNDPT